MTQYETIKKVRNVIKLNGGATISQIAITARIDSRAVTYALSVMGDAYIDRYDERNRPIYDCIEPPPACPKPH